jgi:ABC-2 type transport system permease protein
MTIASDTTAPLSKPTRPYYWSVRRELWEYRSAWIAPLATAGIALFGYVIHLTHLPGTVQEAMTKAKIEQFAMIDAPMGIAAAAVVIAGLVISVFYSLGALNNERRDRSILFWKSLPVSDLTTVLSKLTVPMVIVPAIVFAIIVVLHLIMQTIGSSVLAAHGMRASIPWEYWPPLKMGPVVLYGIVVLTLWWAPIYGWLLLVSAWTKRMTFLWAVLPPLGLGLVEKIGFGTSHVWNLVHSRIGGFMDVAFDSNGGEKALADPFSGLSPLRFLSSPGLWLGIVVAVLLLAGAVWLRRNREPTA